MMVHLRPALKHAQCPVWQAPSQLHDTMSMIACGMGSMVIITGTSLPFTSLKPPDDTGVGRWSWKGSELLTHFAVCWNDRETWPLAASLVGGFSSGLLTVSRVLDRMMSSDLASRLPHMRHMKTSTCLKSAAEGLITLTPSSSSWKNSILELDYIYLCIFVIFLSRWCMTCSSLSSLCLPYIRGRLSKL